MGRVAAMVLLIVEDERKLADALRRGLEEEGYVVEVVGDGAEGQEMAEAFAYDLIILDVLLPTRDGFAVCRALRDRGVQTPILMLTARGAVADRVQGLNTGADDYLAKPFVFDELLARIRALLRREAGRHAPTLAMADLSLDPVAREVRRDGRRIALTRREFQLLEFLMHHPRQVLSRGVIQDRVWGYASPADTNVVDAYIRLLRRKIDAPGEPPLIHTVRGVGYVLRETP